MKLQLFFDHLLYFYLISKNIFIFSTEYIQKSTKIVTKTKKYKYIRNLQNSKRKKTKLITLSHF